MSVLAAEDDPCIVRIRPAQQLKIVFYARNPHVLKNIKDPNFTIVEYEFKYLPLNREISYKDTMQFIFVNSFKSSRHGNKYSVLNWRKKDILFLHIGIPKENNSPPPKVLGCLYEIKSKEIALYKLTDILFRFRAIPPRQIKVFSIAQVEKKRSFFQRIFGLSSNSLGSNNEYIYYISPSEKRFKIPDLIVELFKEQVPPDQGTLTRYYNDSISNLEWFVPALPFAVAHNVALQIAKQKGYRLPSLEELGSLEDSIYKTATLANLETILKNEKSRYYWTSDMQKENQKDIYYFCYSFFNTGAARVVSKSNVYDSAYAILVKNTDANK